MKNPAVSVIVPAHNVEPWLPELLDSLEAQTLKEIEFILVNDGSSDKTGALIDDFASRLPNVLALHHPVARGVSEARNTGLRAASGKWIGFADSDDIAAPELYERLLTYAEAESLDMVLCNSQLFREKIGDLTEKLIKKSKPQVVVDGNDWLSHVIEQDELIITVFVSLSRRADLMRYQHFFMPGIVHEDNLWMVTLMTRSRRLRFFDEVLYYYRRRPSSITNDWGDAMTRHRILSLSTVITQLLRLREQTPSRTANALTVLAAREGRNMLALLRHQRTFKKKTSVCAELYRRGTLRTLWHISTEFKDRRRIVRAWGLAFCNALLPLKQS